MKRATVRRRGDEVVLRFDYDRSLVAAVKGLPRRRFDPFTKEWVLPLHLYMDAVSILQATGASVELDDELKALYEQGAVVPRTRPEVSIGRCGGEYVVQFEYDPSLVKATKKIPGRSFDPASKAWFVPIVDERETLHDLLAAFEGVDCSIRLESKLRALVAS